MDTVLSETRASVTGCGFSVSVTELSDGTFAVDKLYHPTGEIFSVLMPTREAAHFCRMMAEEAIYHLDLIHGISGEV